MGRFFFLVSRLASPNPSSSSNESLLAAGFFAGAGFGFAGAATDTAGAAVVADVTDGAAGFA